MAVKTALGTIGVALLALPVCAQPVPLPLDSAAVAAVGEKPPSFDVRLLPTPLLKARETTLKTRVLKRRFLRGEILHLPVLCDIPFLDAGWRRSDAQNRIWVSDQLWRKGRSWGAVWRKTPLPKKPPSEILRFAPSYLAGYRFDLPSGRYTVRLHFRGGFNPPIEKRHFDITFNGRSASPRFDEFTLSLKTPKVREFRGIEVRRGRLEIGFKGLIGQKRVLDALEIIGETPLVKPFDWREGNQIFDPKAPELTDPGIAVARVDCGVILPRNWVQQIGSQVWLPDLFAPNTAYPDTTYNAIGGDKASRGDYLPFVGTYSPQLVRSERYGAQKYEFSLPNGSYSARLHFAEGFEAIYRAGERVFDVSAQGKIVLPAFDPFMAGGGLGRASVFQIGGLKVEDGVLRIEFAPRKNSASISAIEVFRVPDGETPRVEQLVGPQKRQSLEPAAGSKKQRVLWVGNSFTFFWAIPETVAAHFNRSQKKRWMESYRYLHGGWTLQQFLDPKRDENLGALKAIEAGKYDVVVLQDAVAGYRTGQSGADRWRQALDNWRYFGEVVRKSGARLVIYGIDDPRSWWAGADSQAQLQKVVRELNAIYIPVRQAWNAIGDPRFGGPAPAELVRLNDGIHPSVHEAYIATCLFSLALTGKTPPFPYIVGEELKIEPKPALWCEQFAKRFWASYRAENLSARPALAGGISF